jgi:hypothetical protein
MRTIIQIFNHCANSGLGETPAPGIEAGGGESAQGEGEWVADPVVRTALVSNPSVKSAKSAVSIAGRGIGSP